MKAATFESLSQKGIYSSSQNKLVWCGVVWNLPNQVSLIM